LTLMYLLEHDAKSLLAEHRVPVPAGVLFERDAIEVARLAEGPWVVKGQITAGGRGKAGIIRKAASADEVAEVSRSIIGRTVQGKRVESVRVEQEVARAEEAYIGFLIDATKTGVRVIVSEQGGMEIEALAHEAIRSETVEASKAAIVACV